MFPPIDPAMLLIWLVVSIMAITFHEAAHGLVAYWRGDNTAYMLGRVTANPIPHIDPIGTIGLPVLMLMIGIPFVFGWAKPVPVNYRNLKSVRRDSLLVAAAGPGANILLALCFVLAMRFVLPFVPESYAETTARFLAVGFTLNLVFAVFNMLPFPPLDGSKVLMAVLPARGANYLARLERHGLIIILILLFVLPWLLQQVGIAYNPIDVLVRQPVMALSEWMGGLVGLK